MGNDSVMQVEEVAMNADQKQIRAEALDWLVKTGDPEFHRWDDFTDWLERSPAHADAYHELSSGMAEFDTVLPQLPDNQPSPVETVEERRGLARFAVAASAVILAGTGAYFLSPAFTTDVYRTLPGQTRTIALGAGNQLILNGDTQIEIGGLRRDNIHLAQGQILLRLDGEPRVKVRSGDLTFVDIGTVFDVSRDGTDNRLLVSEGAVLADPDGARVTVGANQMLQAKDGARQIKATSATADAGSWVDGQLSYIDAPIGQVLGDLHRSTGLVFSANPTIGTVRFSGTLSVADIRANPKSLGPLIGASVTREGDRWAVGRSK